jgi:hypothetical protein
LRSYISVQISSSRAEKDETSNLLAGSSSTVFIAFNPKIYAKGIFHFDYFGLLLENSIQRIFVIAGTAQHFRPIPINPISGRGS